MRASYLEIYREAIRDLLSRDPKSSNLAVKESVDAGVYVQVRAGQAAAHRPPLITRGALRRA